MSSVDTENEFETFIDLLECSFDREDGKNLWSNGNFAGNENSANVLRRLGILEVSGGDVFGQLSDGLTLPMIRPCVEFLDKVSMALVPLGSDGCPVYFCSGFVELEDLPFGSEQLNSQSERLIAVGQGMSQAKASLACLGELAERISVLSRGLGDDLVLHNAHADISAGSVMNYSHRQQANLVRNFPDLRRTSKAHGCSIAWEEMNERRVRVTALGKQDTALIPSLVTLLREGPFFGVSNAPITSTNGTASWWNSEGALERAVMELIERDTVACWWANRLYPDRWSLADVRNCLPEPLAEWMGERKRQTHFLSLPTDLSCTIVAAISYDQSGSNLAYGFKASLATANAIKGAALEMVQMEMHLQTVLDNSDGGQHPLMQLSKTTDVTKTPWLYGTAAKAKRECEVPRWPDFMDELADNNIPVWFFDTSRSDLNVPTMRAISPVLRDWSSRFGPGRLYDLPVKLGLRASALREEELNPIRFVS